MISYLSKDQNVLNGRVTFIFQEFDVEMIKIEINNILKDCIRPTWEEAAYAINRHLKWEYDNLESLLLLSRVKVIGSRTISSNGNSISK